MGKKIHRFCSPFRVSGNELTIREASVLHQITHVLHLRPGEEIAVFDGDGTEYLVNIFSDRSDGLITHIKQIRNEKRGESGVLLCAAMLKRENFEIIIQKAAELGVYALMPVLTEHTVKRGFRRDRLEAIIREAIEQCGGVYLPRLLDPCRFDEAIAYAKKEGFSPYVFDLEGQAFQDHRPEKTAIFIGPEGGWGSHERSHMVTELIPILSLGERTYRAETAAIIASYLFCRL